MAIAKLISLKNNQFMNVGLYKIFAFVLFCNLFVSMAFSDEDIHFKELSKLIAQDKLDEFKVNFKSKSLELNQMEMLMSISFEKQLAELFLFIFSEIDDLDKENILYKVLSDQMANKEKSEEFLKKVLSDHEILKYIKNKDKDLIISANNSRNYIFLNTILQVLKELSFDKNSGFKFYINFTNGYLNFLTDKKKSSRLEVPFVQCYLRLFYMYGIGRPESYIAYIQISNALTYIGRREFIISDIGRKFLMHPQVTGQFKDCEGMFEINEREVKLLKPLVPNTNLGEFGSKNVFKILDLLEKRDQQIIFIDNFFADKEFAKNKFSETFIYNNYLSDWAVECLIAKVKKQSILTEEEVLEESIKYLNFGIFKAQLKASKEKSIQAIRAMKLFDKLLSMPPRADSILFLDLLLAEVPFEINKSFAGLYKINLSSIFTDEDLTQPKYKLIYETIINSN